MCGIAGLWFQSEIKEEVLKRYGTLVGNALLNRGPDAEGLWADFKSAILFSHRRLSIRDLSQNGSQPMKSHDNNLVMIFNGEIYNFEELRKELNFKNWKGTSDTEVLLFAIQEWGLKKALKKCYGMFALALWNCKKKTLTIARDRFGEKPLYWGHIKINGVKDSIIAFTSDLKALWSIPEINKEIEYDAFSDYLKYGYVNAPKSIHRNIHQLLPGHLVELESNNRFAPQKLAEPICWWDIKEVSKKCYSYQTNKENFFFLEEELIKVINQQQLADVPTASFLSGGIDSSLITALLQSQNSKKIKTFNISFPDNGNGEKLFDEGPYAKKIASYLGTDHTEIPLSWSEMQSVIPNLADVYSEPFSDSSQIATYLICKGIKSNGIKVAIGGDGADELFGGYNRHKFLPLIHERFKKLPYLIKSYLGDFIKLIPSSNQNLSQEKTRKLIASIKKSANLEEIYDVILSNNENIKIFHNFEEKENSNLLKFNSIFAPTNTEKIMLADCISYLPNNILVKLDRAAMAFGLETRTPFLDERIANIAWSIDLNNKLYNKNNRFESKSILKKILYKYVPENYFKRPKTGFALPIASWLRGPLKEWAGDLLNSELINRQGYLSSNNIRDIWNSHIKGQSDNTELIWTILMWQLWMEKWEKHK